MKISIKETTEFVYRFFMSGRVENFTRNIYQGYSRPQECVSIHYSLRNSAPLQLFKQIRKQFFS